MSGFARKMKRQAIGHTPTPREVKMLQALKTAAYVLKQYADGSNWADTARGFLWVGEGNGPDLAEKVLGLKKEPKPEAPKEPANEVHDEKAVQRDHPEGVDLQEESTAEGKAG